MRVGPEVRMRSAGIGLALIAALAAQAAAGEGGTGLRSAAPDAPVFSARLYGAPFAIIAIVPNPIVTACYKATPEYTYLYTPAGMVGAPPPIRLHTYGADTRYSSARFRPTIRAPRPIAGRARRSTSMSSARIPA